jgi:hypothetical protein
MDSAFTLTPDTSKTDLTITTLTATAIIVMRKNISGTAGTVTIIGTITIEIMIGIEVLPICFPITNFLA